MALKTMQILVKKDYLKKYEAQERPLNEIKTKQTANMYKLGVCIECITVVNRAINI